jgi:hypothetical protein
MHIFLLPFHHVFLKYRPSQLRPFRKEQQAAATKTMVIMNLSICVLLVLHANGILCCPCFPLWASKPASYRHLPLIGKSADRSILSTINNGYGVAMMLTWRRQKPDTPGWYWMLSPDHHSSLPTVIQIMFDGRTSRWLALIPPCQDPRHPGKEVKLQDLDAVWAGP